MIFPGGIDDETNERDYFAQRPASDIQVENHSDKSDGLSEIAVRVVALESEDEAEALELDAMYAEESQQAKIFESALI